MDEFSFTRPSQWANLPWSLVILLVHDMLTYLLSIYDIEQIFCNPRKTRTYWYLRIRYLTQRLDHIESICNVEDFKGNALKCLEFRIFSWYVYRSIFQVTKIIIIYSLYYYFALFVHCFIDYDNIFHNDRTILASLEKCLNFILFC